MGNAKTKRIYVARSHIAKVSLTRSGRNFSESMLFLFATTSQREHLPRRKTTTLFSLLAKLVATPRTFHDLKDGIVYRRLPWKRCTAAPRQASGLACIFFAPVIVVCDS